MSRSYLQPRTRLKLNSSARARAADFGLLASNRASTLVMITLLVTQLTLIVQRSAYADPAHVELSKSCVIEDNLKG